MTSTIPTRVLHEAAGLARWPAYGVVEITGRERVTFLHGMVTNEVKRLTPGRAARIGLTTPTAKLLAEGLLLAESEQHRWVGVAERVPTVLATLDRYLITEDVMLRDATERTAVLSVEGPRAHEVLAAAGAPALEPLQHATVTLDGHAARLVRHTITGLPGFMLLLARDAIPAVWDRLLEIGRAAGLQPVEPDALNAARIEQGVPWFGIDIDESWLLPETGLETVAVSQTKGCYVGQEVIARMDAHGSAARRIAALRIDGTDLPVVGDQLKRGEEPAGIVTSACRSMDGHPLALAAVKRPFYEPGTALEILRGDSRLRATVAVTRPPAA